MQNAPNCAILGPLPRYCSACRNEAQDGHGGLPVGEAVSAPVVLFMPLHVIHAGSAKLYLDEDILSLHEWVHLLNTDSSAILRAAWRSGAGVIKICIKDYPPTCKRFMLVYEFPRIIAGLAHSINEQAGAGYFHPWARTAEITQAGIRVTVPHGPQLLYTFPQMNKNMHVPPRALADIEQRES